LPHRAQAKPEPASPADIPVDAPILQSEIETPKEGTPVFGGGENEEEVRTHYYQAGGGVGPMRLPSFKDLAAAEAAGQPLPDLKPAEQAAPAAPPPQQPAPQPFSKPAVVPTINRPPSAAKLRPLEEAKAESELVAVVAQVQARADQATNRAAVIVQAQERPVSARAKTVLRLQPIQAPPPKPAVAQSLAPAPLPMPVSAQPALGIPWAKLGMMAAIGAVVGLVIALGLAVVMRFLQH